MKIVSMNEKLYVYIYIYINDIVTSKVAALICVSLSSNKMSECKGQFGRQDMSAM